MVVMLHISKGTGVRTVQWVGSDDSSNDEVNGLLLNPNGIISYRMSRRGSEERRRTVSSDDRI